MILNGLFLCGCQYDISTWMWLGQLKDAEAEIVKVLQSRQEAEQQISASKVKMEVLSNYFKDKEKEMMRFVSSNCVVHDCHFYFASGHGFAIGCLPLPVLEENLWPQLQVLLQTTCRCCHWTNDVKALMETTSIDASEWKLSTARLLREVTLLLTPLLKHLFASANVIFLDDFSIYIVTDAWKDDFSCLCIPHIRLVLSHSLTKPLELHKPDFCQ